MKTSLIIPLPPGTEGQAAKGESKPAVGLYPCMNDGVCGEYMLVKLDTQGRPYADCSKKEITGKGCTRKGPKGLPEDVPPQTFGDYLARFDAVTAAFPMPTPYRLYLEREWQAFNEKEAADGQCAEAAEQ